MPGCPVCALVAYVRRIGPISRTDQLFVTFHSRILGRALSKLLLSRWVVEAIRQA